MPLLEPQILKGSPLPPAGHWPQLTRHQQLAAGPDELLLFLEPVATEAAYAAVRRLDLLQGDDGWGNRPFSPQRYQRLETYLLSKDNALKKWLYRRPAELGDAVIVLPVFAPVDTPALLLSWKLLIRLAPELFSADNLLVVDNALRWCLYYHHDGKLSFASLRA